MTDNEKKLVNDAIAEVWDAVRAYRDDVEEHCGSWLELYDLNEALRIIDRKRMEVMYG